MLMTAPWQIWRIGTLAGYHACQAFFNSLLEEKVCGVKGSVDFAFAGEAIRKLWNKARREAQDGKNPLPVAQNYLFLTLGSPAVATQSSTSRVGVTFGEFVAANSFSEKKLAGALAIAELRQDQKLGERWVNTLVKFGRQAQAEGGMLGELVGPRFDEGIADGVWSKAQPAEIQSARKFLGAPLTIARPFPVFSITPSFRKLMNDGLTLIQSKTHTLTNGCPCTSPPIEYGALDWKGRATYGLAFLQQSNISPNRTNLTGDPHTDNGVNWWDQLPATTTWVRGHLIASQFGGMGGSITNPSSPGRQNFVPLDEDVNNGGAYAQMEAYVRS